MTVTNLTDAVVTGTAREGSVLSTTDGTWTHTMDNIAFAYQWLRCDSSGANCAAIPGATGRTLTLTAADVGHKIRAQVSATESDDPPPSPTPGGGDPKLRWAPPTLSSPTVRALTNTARSVPRGGGGDLRITAQAHDLTGAIGQVEAYGDVEMIAGAIVGGSANTSGHVIPRELTGTFHMEGWRVALTTYADAISVRWRAPIVQIENCYVEVTKASTSYHSDGFQSQEGIIDELRFDRCTFKTDYQGIFLSNETQVSGPAKSKVAKVIMSRVLFLQGAQGLPATFFFKAFPTRPNADPIGLTEMYDVWMPATSAINKVYPNGTWNAWDGSPQRYGCFLTTKVHPINGSTPFVRFSTTADTVTGGALSGQQCGDCGVRGDGGIWLYNNVNEVPDDVGSASDAGRGYASPGYL